MIKSQADRVAEMKAYKEKLFSEICDATYARFYEANAKEMDAMLVEAVVMGTGVTQAHLDRIGNLMGQHLDRRLDVDG